MRSTFTEITLKKQNKTKQKQKQKNKNKKHKQKQKTKKQKQKKQKQKTKKQNIPFQNGGQNNLLILHNNAYANKRKKKATESIKLFFTSKKVYPAFRQLEKITVKKAQAKVVFREKQMLGP